MKKIIVRVNFFSLLLLFACSGEDPQSSNGDSNCNLETYSLQCEISSNHQSMEFDYCYPSNLIGEKFSFSNHFGKVFMIEMSASW
jgi:hypothetical protein